MSVEHYSVCPPPHSHKSFAFCGLYAAFVFAGQHLMRERPKLNLRRPLVLWSLSLAVFRWVRNASPWRIYQYLDKLGSGTKASSLCSIAGALRTGFYMLHMIRTAGFRDSVCDNAFYSAPITKLWAYAFALSKAPELGEAPALLNVLAVSRKSSRRLRGGG